MNRIEVVDSTTTFQYRLKLFLKSWAIAGGLGLWLPILFLSLPIENYIHWYFISASIIGLAVAIFILRLTRASSKHSGHLGCPFCHSHQLGVRESAMDRSTSNAMLGYMAFGRSGLLLGCMPDEVRHSLICYGCNSKFEYSETLIIQINAS